MTNTRTFLGGPDGITVLSVFDGMSCGQLALQRLGVKVKQYYASEIDKPAMKVTQRTFPNTIQLYRMLGNGWNVDVICHILSYLPLVTTQQHA